MFFLLLFVAVVLWMYAKFGVAMTYELLRNGVGEGSVGVIQFTELL
jgi:hypothetical protein